MDLKSLVMGIILLTLGLAVAAAAYSANHRHLRRFCQSKKAFAFWKANAVGTGLAIGAMAGFFIAIAIRPSSIEGAIGLACVSFLLLIWSAERFYQVWFGIVGVGRGSKSIQTPAKLKLG